jgi:hypothetical protein
MGMVAQKLAWEAEYTRARLADVTDPVPRETVGGQQDSATTAAA